MSHEESQYKKNSEITKVKISPPAMLLVFQLASPLLISTRF